MLKPNPLITSGGAIASPVSKSFSVDRDNLPCTVFAFGLAGAESVAIEMHDGNAFRAVRKSGSAVVLNVDNNTTALVEPGEYQVTIAASAGAVRIGSY